MPDAHQGYGLPIGGVLATDNAVIPYAVGVDIACRMKMTVLDLPVSALTMARPELTRAIEKETEMLGGVETLNGGLTALAGGLESVAAHFGNVDRNVGTVGAALLK